jgi:hypothetical protein
LNKKAAGVFLIGPWSALPDDLEEEEAGTAVRILALAAIHHLSVN